MNASRIAVTDIEVSELSEVYDFSRFDCEDTDLNEFLKRDSFTYKTQFIAKTFIVIYDEQVVAFFSVMNDAIKLKIQETQGTKKLIRLHEYPALKIGRLGVDKRFTRRGLGTTIIHFVIGLTQNINQISACRFVTVDAYPQAMAFYEKYGFVRNQMYKKRQDFVSLRLDIIVFISERRSESIASQAM